MLGDYRIMSTIVSEDDIDGMRRRFYSYCRLIENDLITDSVLRLNSETIVGEIGYYIEQKMKSWFGLSQKWANERIVFNCEEDALHWLSIKVRKQNERELRSQKVESGKIGGDVEIALLELVK